MAGQIEAQGSILASKISELTNATAQAETNEERVQIQNQINQIILQQYQLMNTYSQSVGLAAAGRDADKVGMVQPPETRTDVDTPVEPQKEKFDVMPEIEKEAGEPIQPGQISPYQAKFKFNNVDRGYLVEQWKKNYQSKDRAVEGLSATIRLLLGTNDMPQEAADQVNQVANAFDGDGGFNKDQIAEMLNAIGFIESKYETKVQRKGGPARSYWQVEPSTAADMLKQNLSAMKTGRSPLMGQKFENLFKSKYADAIGNKTALEYFASLNEKQLQQLLLEDGLFAAAMAAHKVVSTFDPYGSREV
tara:strand:- start:617 stop:1531 length:915 start_codon:yes stop_codon:yes gene_type:complete